MVFFYLFFSRCKDRMTVLVGGINSCWCCGEAATPTTIFSVFSNKQHRHCYRAQRVEQSLVDKQFPLATAAEWSNLMSTNKRRDALPCVSTQFASLADIGHFWEGQTGRTDCCLTLKKVDSQKSQICTNYTQRNRSCTSTK